MLGVRKPTITKESNPTCDAKGEAKRRRARQHVTSAATLRTQAHQTQESRRRPPFKLRVEERALNPPKIRLQNCACCRDEYLGRRKHTHATVTQRHTSEVLPQPRLRKRHINLEPFNQNDYFALRDHGDNTRPKSTNALAQNSRDSGDGNAYMHIQQKIAGLLHLLEETNLDETHCSVLDNSDSVTHERLIGTSELLSRQRNINGKANQFTTPQRRRWFDRVLSESSVGTIPLDNDCSWSLEANRLRGSPSHREEFSDTFQTIYRRMHRVLTNSR